MFILFFAFFVFAFVLSVRFRCAVLHPVLTVTYGYKDLKVYIQQKRFDLCPTGALDIYCGYFGCGKTLSLVHKVTGLYKRYNGCRVWDNRQKKFVTQRVLVLSNVDLAIPYIHLESLSQIVAQTRIQQKYDDENGTLTITVALLDELSVQMNSRSFKDNIDAYFLNTLLTCRHYHLNFYGSSQRFGHCDKLLRDVTHTVIQCKKWWRFQINQYYDAWDLENSQNPELVKPLATRCWFVRNADYDAYDTLAVVDNLKKKMDEGDILNQAEILANQQSPSPVGMDAVSCPSRAWKRNHKR